MVAARVHPITHTLMPMRISFIAFTADKKTNKQTNKTKQPRSLPFLSSSLIQISNKVT